MLNFNTKTYLIMRIMKLYNNILSIIAGFTLIFGVMSCEELEVGNDFLSKPPTIDYTKDSVFKSARKAKELLWKISIF